MLFFLCFGVCRIYGLQQTLYLRPDKVTGNIPKDTRITAFFSLLSLPHGFSIQTPEITELVQYKKIQGSS
jgi:hypothetical protein